jgi:isopenicillin-N epimerase
MWSRREFLRISGMAGAAQTPDDVARDESYWRQVQEAFDVDRSLINLNNGNSSPCPRNVHESVKRGLDFSNQLPVYYRGILEEKMDGVRRQLAETFGCGEDEIAITRNATEALHIAQCGLDLKPGDEVLTTDQDYTLMLWAWDQRARRDNIVVKRVQFPVPTTAGDLVRLFERAITRRTKVMHFCHITNVTGQLFPVRELSRLAREHGIVTIVDGAQAAAHFPFTLKDLECDVYGTSLHKWLMAPHGTGFLYVRRERIGKIWPLHAELDSLRADIRKYEEVGTQSAAARVAIADALMFHQAVGAERKAARLRYLTLRWADALKDHPGVRMLSNLDAGQTWGLATLGLERDVDVQAVVRMMFDKYRIVTSAAESQRLPGPIFDFQGLRLTPNVYTTIGEIDAFVAAMTDALEKGLPRRA